jgi:hypothetical protein
MHEGDNPSFWDEYMKFYFFLDRIIHIRIIKQVPKYLATRLKRPSGTNSRGLDVWRVICPYKPRWHFMCADITNIRFNTVFGT